MQPYENSSSPIGSQTDIAYRKLYKMLIRSRPGDRVVWYERVLGQNLQMGRTPVREALKRLQNEGLLVPSSLRGGLVAAHIPTEEVENIYQVRSALETVAAELAATRSQRGELSSAQLAELAGRAEVIKERIAVGDNNGATEANSAFHRFITQLAANPYLQKPLEQLWSRITLSALNNLVDDAQWAAAVNADHDEIVRCVSAGDAPGAATIARDHIRRAIDVYTAHHGAGQESNTHVTPLRSARSE